uniref:BHLH domain-containing protein n=1 Tax=Aegilops tauschii subsp. strangulata TaxID=200361 RepID=A0A453FPX0_AEGTS
MADEWWSGSQRSHGTSACSAAPLMDTGHAATCGWTSPAAESTSSITFQDPHRSSSTITHQPSSDAASSLGDAHMDWTHAFLSGRSDASFQAVLQDDTLASMTARPLFRAHQPALDEAVMSNPFRAMSHSFSLLDQVPAASSPYGTAPLQGMFDSTGASHNVSVLGECQSSTSYGGTAAMHLNQAATQMLGGGAQLQYLSGSGGFMPFGGAPLSSQLLLQALQPKTSYSSSSNTLMAKVRKEKLGDRITALQQLVSPFGKTDTASVLHEANEYIKFLHDQVASLTYPYLKNVNPLQQFQQKGSENAKDDGGEPKKDLRSRGLCLVPVATTYTVASETVPEFWYPTFGGTFR